MRPSLVIACLALLAASCQTADRGTPPDASTPKAAPQEIPVTIQQTPAPAPAPASASAPAPASASAPAQAPTSAMGSDADCSADVALECKDTEVDGCLTGQATVHRCVSTTDQ